MGGGLLGVVPHRLPDDARGLEEACNAVCRLRTVAEPVLDALHIHLHALLAVLGQQRVVGAELLDEAAVARHAGVGGHDAVEGPLLGAATGESDLDGHRLSPSNGRGGGFETRPTLGVVRDA
jgi:hypothetical protein